MCSISKTYLFTKGRAFSATECDWLSVKQLIIYHTVLLVHKSIMGEASRHLLNRMQSSAFPYKTRLADSGNIRLDESFKGGGLVRDSFRYRGTMTYNMILAF